MTEPQDPQSTPPNYPTYPGQGNQPPATPSGQPGPPAPSQPYPNQPYAQPGLQADPGQRPGGVTAAGWITIVLSFLTLLTSLAAFAASNRFAEEFRDAMVDNPDDFNINASEVPTLDELQGVMIGGGAIFLVVGIIGILLGFAVLKRQVWARILLIVTSALTAIVGLAASIVIVGIPWLAGAIAVLVLLLSSKASAWFKAGKA